MGFNFIICRLRLLRDNIVLNSLILLRDDSFFNLVFLPFQKLIVFAAKFGKSADEVFD